MKSKTEPLVAGIAALCGFDGAANIALVLFVGMVGVGSDVGSVHGKAGNDFAQRIAQTFQSEVARTAMLLGDAVQAAGKHIEFAGHRDLHDQALALVDKIGVALRPSGKLAGKADGKSGFGGVNEQSIEQIQKAVAGGAFDGPARPKFFVPTRIFSAAT